MPNLDWMKRAEDRMRAEMEQGGPFTDNDARHLLGSMALGQKVNDTQNAIIPYIKQMAAIMAEAARSSAMAAQELSAISPAQARLAAEQIGTDPFITLERWIDVLRKEASQLILEQACTPQSGTKNEMSMRSLLDLKTLTTANPQLEALGLPESPTDSSATKDDSSGSK